MMPLHARMVNDCLYTGPNFGQSILDLLLRQRLHKVALIGDIEKAFLMVFVAEPDRDVLRFLWIRDPSDPQSKVITLRFTRVVFGVSASPFLLNATVDYHMQRYVELDPDFVMKFRRSIYVDDLTASFPDDDSAYEFYVKSKTRLAEANFNLRKFQTNSSDLRQRIKTNGGGSKSSPAGAEECHVLGIRWNIEHDKLIFDFGDICDRMRSADPTKRNAVSLATRFFDPLGVLSPIAIRFKMLFQQLCREGVGWDEPLKGESLALWNRLSADLDHTQTVDIPRLYKARVSDVGTAVRLVGYCDASKKAYAATVYLQMKMMSRVLTEFVCSKTRVAPLTIPRLELLSALLLARLMSTVQTALEPELALGEPVCSTDSQVALFWICGENREWKQFVQNR